MLKSIRYILVSTVLASSLTGFANPVSNMQGQPKSNQFWWPNQLDLSPLRKAPASSNPMGPNFNYAKEFSKLDLDAVKKDIAKVMTTSQDWWPADYGNYGPFFIRMAWHSAGTYRISDGRGGADGGQQRLEPLNSWPDNANLDKARRLLWPVKQKYGNQISWADLMVLTGNVALETMGFKTYGFAGGRTDDYVSDLIYWGPETKFLEDKRFDGNKLEKPLAATQMGLIYVNPEGPNGNPDPKAAAAHIRETFGRMAMNDEETVALIAGGHTFGKAHGAHNATECLGPEPAAAPIQQQDFGWHNKCGTGKGPDAITSGLEGAWSVTPVNWSHQYLNNLFAFNWVKTKTPSGATQWIPAKNQAANLVPDAFDKNIRHAPIMFTTDLSLKEDPSYRKIAERFQKNPKEFEKAFAKAWFKLTHRDMGPSARYLGKDIPKEEMIWQDPIPKANYKMINSADINNLKKQISKSDLTNSELVKAAWAAASTYRDTDKRGGANGGRIRLQPQINWQANNPKELAKVLKVLEQIQTNFNKSQKGKQVSVADLVVLGGNVAIERAAKQAGQNIQVPFYPGRTDASQAQTDVKSFAVLKPSADAFRNYFDNNNYRTPAELLVDKAEKLNLSIPEVTVLIGGMRVLGANYDNSKNGVLTNKPGTLTNDFFVNLLDMSTKWSKTANTDNLYIGADRKTGKPKWTATSVDLIFGANSELRAVAEVYATNDSQKKFTNDFITAWNKVMNADRFDLVKKS